MTVDQTTPWRSIGNTDRASFRAALGRSVKSDMPSPLAPLADAIYTTLAPQGLTRLAATILWEEQKNATWYPEAQQYGMYRSYRNPYSVKDSKGGWKQYPDDLAATQDWITLVTGPAFAATTTLHDFIYRYAPPSENDSAGYVARVVSEINALPTIASVQTPPPASTPDPAPNPSDPGPPIATAPTIYNIANPSDASRFGLDPAEVRYLLSRSFAGRDGRRPAFIVLHIQDGITTGSLDWWIHGVDGNGSRIQASSTVTAQKDGSILQVIPERDGPWTNGDVQSPDAQGNRLVQLGDNPNVWTLSLEAEGWHGGVLPDVQRDAIVWQVDQWQRTYSIPTRNILGHYSINSVTRNLCGRYLPDILPRLTYGGQQPPMVVFAKPGPVPDWDGYDAVVNGATWYAIDRVLVCQKAGTPCLQYASRKSAPVRGPLAVGEAVWAAWFVVNEGEAWIVTKFGSRIPLSGLLPTVSFSGAAALSPAAG